MRRGASTENHAHAVERRPAQAMTRTCLTPTDCPAADPRNLLAHDPDPGAITSPHSKDEGDEHHAADGDDSDGAHQFSTLAGCRRTVFRRESPAV
jgi:hypothetical protein